MRSRRVGTLAAAAVVAAGLVTTATTPAFAERPGPRPVSTWLDAVEAHRTSWVSVFWWTGRKICAAEVTVDGGGMAISYPENTGTYTSFSLGDKLKAQRTDYTAFTVHPEDDFAGDVRLTATLSYNTCGHQAVEKSVTYRLSLPVLPATYS